jgi:hypothetical protein
MLWYDDSFYSAATVCFTISYSNKFQLQVRGVTHILMKPLLIGDEGFSIEVQETQLPSNFIKITFLSHNQNQIINLTHDQNKPKLQGDKKN